MCVIAENDVEKTKHPGNFIDLTGMKFNRLTAIEYVGQGGSGARWKFQCDCGNVKIMNAYHVKHGYAKSCGCWNEENKHDRYRIHGLTNTKIQSAWSHIKQRCLNPKSKEYRNYGGRGIGICEEWKNSVAAFAKWAYANGYQEDLTIDRIDNNGDYTPENCRWVSMEVQENNKRNNHYYSWNGESITLSQIAKRNGISRDRLYYRLHIKGMDLQAAINYCIAHK